MRHKFHFVMSLPALSLGLRFYASRKGGTGGGGWVSTKLQALMNAERGEILDPRPSKLKREVFATKKPVDSDRNFCGGISHSLTIVRVVLSSCN